LRASYDKFGDGAQPWSERSAIDGDGTAAPAVDAPAKHLA
jgi:hypothetical protein